MTERYCNSRIRDTTDMSYSATRYFTDNVSTEHTQERRLQVLSWDCLAQISMATSALCTAIFTFAFRQDPSASERLITIEHVAFQAMPFQMIKEPKI